MPLKDSQARLKASRVTPDFWRWKGADLAPMFEHVAKHGGPEKCDFRAVPGLNERGEPDLHLVVVAGGAETAFNFSHPCPPDCD